jgi:hypothetical protein
MQQACQPTQALAPAATMLACLTALKSLRPQQGEDQVTQQAGGDEAGKRIIENHFRSPQRRSQTCA